MKPSIKSHKRILKSLSDDMEKTIAIDPLSDREVYSYEKVNTKKMFKIYKSKDRHGSHIDEDTRFNKILKKEGFKKDVALYVENKMRFFKQKNLQSQAKVDKLTEYKAWCQTWFNDIHAELLHLNCDTLEFVWNRLKTLLERLLKIYRALSERWMILESMLREISEGLDRDTISIYRHKSQKKMKLYKYEHIRNMLSFNEVEWEHLFSNTDT